MKLIDRYRCYQAFGNDDEYVLDPSLFGKMYIEILFQPFMMRIRQQGDRTKGIDDQVSDRF